MKSPFARQDPARLAAARLAQVEKGYARSLAGLVDNDKPLADILFDPSISARFIRRQVRKAGNKTFHIPTPYGNGRLWYVYNEAALAEVAIRRNDFA